ncbi:MAG: TIGR02710 family CRISPR-associated CARF protein [Thermus sp.]|nr:TIGR02710 family CRISPR-associated CARF protein [Thermus sp.]
MENLDILWDEFKKAVREGGDANTLYRERVWPVLKEAWRKEPPVYPSPRKFAVSVHTLGTSPEATALAILGTQAEKVYILHTDLTAKYLPWLREETGKEVYPLKIGKSDVEAIYRHVKELLDEHRGKPVALDLTSGTKAMSAGLAAAGFYFQRYHPQVWVVYVDNEEYDSEVRRPKAGTERLVILPNPHEVLADVDALLALEFYGRGEFAKAEEIFGKMVGKTGDQAYTLYGLLCGMYRAWYALDLAEAVKKGRALLERLEQNVWINHPLNAHRKTLEGQVALLEAGQDFLSSQDPCRSLGALTVVETLLYLSERAKEASLALASLYTYRALELLLQERLCASLGLRAEDPALGPEDQEALKAELARILRVEVGEVRLGPKLGLLDLVALLRAKGDGVLGKWDLGSLQGLAGVLKARNESLLVHGFRVPSAKERDALNGLCQPLLQDLRNRLGNRVLVGPVDLDQRH